MPLFHKTSQKLKPSIPEFAQICKAVAVGFAVMGFIGYFVKLIHIPMYVTKFCVNYCRLFTSSHRNNILVYVQQLFYIASSTHISKQRRRIGDVFCIYWLIIDSVIPPFHRSIKIISLTVLNRLRTQTVIACMFTTTLSLGLLFD